MPLVTVRYCPSAGQDIQLFYDTFGDRSTGQPLLLVMGLGGQMILWRTEFCERLAEEGFFVIRFDNRDVGLSSHLDHLGCTDVVSMFLGSLLGVSAPYTIHDMALDAAALLDHLGVPQAHLCGFSMGGLIVQQMAVSFPERVLSLTTVSSPAGLSGCTLRGKIAVLRLSSQDPDDDIQRTVNVVKSVSTRKYFDEQECEACVREVVARSPYIGGVPRQLAAILAAGYGVPDVHTVRAPTMVFHGTEDPIVPPESGKVLASAISGARLFMLKDGAHDLPPEIDEILIDGLKENAGIVDQRLPEHYAGYEAEGRSEPYNHDEYDQHYDSYAREDDDVSSSAQYSAENWSFDSDPLSASTPSDFSASALSSDGDYGYPPQEDAYASGWALRSSDESYPPEYAGRVISA
eukprot:RCo052597